MQTTTMFLHQRNQAIFAGAFAFGLLLTSSSVHAHSFCVATATELQNALSDSSDGGLYAGEFNEIDVVHGTYTTGSATGNGPFHYNNSTTSVGHLHLLGGWNSGCATRKQKAAITVLDGNNSTQVLSLRQTANELDVTALTIQNGQTTRKGAGLEVNFVSGDNSRLVITGNIIRNNHTTNSDGGLFITSGTSDLFFEHNLITDNSADGGNGAGSAISGGVGAVYNNTVSGNTTTLTSGTGGLYFSSPSNGFVTNNIFWNNTTYGIYLGSANVYLDYNDYGTQGGVAPRASAGNLSTDPRFVDVAGGDFHLMGNSPLLGVTAPPGVTSVDPDGNANPAQSSNNPAQSKGDMGAYNETIFIDGFEGG